MHLYLSVKKGAIGSRRNTVGYSAAGTAQNVRHCQIARRKRIVERGASGWCIKVWKCLGSFDCPAFLSKTLHALPCAVIRILPLPDMCFFWPIPSETIAARLSWFIPKDLECPSCAPRDIRPTLLEFRPCRDG